MAQLEAQQQPTKPPVQSTPEEQPSVPRDSHYQDLIAKFKESGHSLRSDSEQPSFSQKPEWYDEELFNRAKEVYARHFMGINFAHLSGLLLLVRVDSIYRTLVETGQSATVAKLFHRYYHTILHVKKWYEGDIFEENSEAQRSLMIVRGMHNRVSTSLNGGKSAETKGDDKSHSTETTKSFEGDSTERKHVSSSITSQPQDTSMVHISQYDLMITQFAFIGFIVTKTKSMGLITDFDEKDLASLLHFWRVIGHYLGAKNELNLCSHDSKDIAGLCEAILELEYRDSVMKNPLQSPQGIMSLNIIRSVKFIPLLTFYGIMRYLYELLGIETTEIDDRKTCYSNMSYTFIKLVMSNLLGYRPLRAFNNGITRLSVHLVGKIENWFSNRLTSSYGEELKL